MNDPITIAMYAACGAAAGALLLVPLARLIPLRMFREFDEASTDNGYPPPPLDESRFLIPTSDKVWIGAGGAVAGLLAASVPGTPFAMAALCIYLLGLILLAEINIRHELLPDEVVLPLLWVGLLVASQGAQLKDHVLGAAVGYVAPFVLVKLIKLLTKKDVLGYGDLKAFAMAGAWFGFGALPLVFGVFVGSIIPMISVEKLRGRSGPFRTGVDHMLTSLFIVISIILR